MARNTSTSFQPVEDWLRGLGLLHFAQSFYDNGYEDMDTCKQIGARDLEEIGVTVERDRNDILNAVNRLKQNLYFELEPEEKKHDIKRTKLETVLLKSKLKECLQKHNVQLIEPPYFNPDGSLGDLYPLAIRFADEFETYFNDVMDALEQLRKRQLPLQSYEQINSALNVADTGQDKRRRSMTTTDASGASSPVTNDPADYLNCETPTKRGYSVSRNDPRVTKSTTDLTQELQSHSMPSSIKSTKKFDQKSKGIFSSMFKKKDGKSSTRDSHCDFKATDITMTQGEIVRLFAKVKNHEISQEAALADIRKRGLSKSNSDAKPKSDSPESSPEIEVKLKRKGKFSKSMITRTTPSAQFYTQDNDDVVGSSSVSQRRKTSALDVDAQSIDNSKSSPEIAKPGIFKIIRSSLRKKTKGNDDSPEKEGQSSSGSTSSQENLVASDTANNTMFPGNQRYVDSHTSSAVSCKASTDVSTAPPVPVRVDLSPVVEPASIDEHFKPTCSAPLPPPKHSSKTKESIKEPDVIIDSQHTMEDDGGFQERRPSLKIKSYPKYQEQSQKRRSNESNNMSPGKPRLPPRKPILPPVSLGDIRQASIKLNKVKGDVEHTISDESHSLPSTPLISNQKSSDKNLVKTFNVDQVKKLSNVKSHSSNETQLIPTPRSSVKKNDIKFPEHPKQTSKLSDKKVNITPPRPPLKRLVGSSSPATPVALPRRKKSLLISEKHIDEIGNQMNQLIDGLNDELTSLNVTAEAKLSTVKEKTVSSDNKFINTNPKHFGEPALPPRIPPTTTHPRKASTISTKSDNSDDVFFKPSKSEGLINKPRSKNEQKVIFEQELNKSSLMFEKVCQELSNPNNNVESFHKGAPERKTLKLSLEQIIVKKLRKEMIEIENEPYTSQDGSWQIPYSLLERYGDELEYTTGEIIRAFDEVREERRIKKSLPFVPVSQNDLSKNKRLSRSASLDDWLIHIGLPMFAEDFHDVDIKNIQEVSELSKDNFKQIGVFDDKHVSLLLQKAHYYVAS